MKLNERLLDSRSLPSRAQQEVTSALTTSFPIRGWHMSYDLTPAPEETRFKVYLTRYQLDEEKKIIGDPPFENLLADHLKMTATQKIPQVMTFLGKTLQFSPQCVEKQFVNLRVEALGLDIEFDPKKIKTFTKDDVWIPDTNAFAAMVEKWVGKKPENEKRATWVLGQLAAVRENYFSQMRRLLGLMAQTIKQETPDYWMLMELVMTGRMDPSEAMKLAGDAIIVKTADPSTTNLTRM